MTAASLSHSTRAHMPWSPSASDKLWSCPGYLALSRHHTDRTSKPGVRKIHDKAKKVFQIEGEKV